MKIDTSGCVYQHVDTVPSQELFPGVRIRLLFKGLDNAKALILEMDAGTCWPEIDLHTPGSEEVFVLDGVLNDGERDCPAGTFLHSPAGSSHLPQTTTGCRLFVFYPRG